MTTLNKIGILLCLASVCWACSNHKNEQLVEKKAPAAQDTTESRHKTAPSMSILEQKLVDQGLLNLKEVDTTLIIDLRYSTTHNFVGVDVYGDLENAYMRPEPAGMLSSANAYLKEEHPDYTLYIFDAVRPRSVQQIFWDTLDYPYEQKIKYVADPQQGSIHNYGAAVDLTIAGPDGIPLDMGTEFDYFGVLAYPVREDELLAAGKLTQEQVNNRRLLRKVMIKAGFSPITSEWWHFNAMSRAEADKKYGIVE